MGAAKQTVGELFQAMSKTNQRRIPRGGFGADGGRATSMFGFAYSVSGHYAVSKRVDAPDDERGNRHRHQRTEYFGDGDVGEREHQHDEVREKIGLSDRQLREPHDNERQCVVSARGAARAHDEPHTDADEQTAEQRGEEGLIGKRRQNRTEVLKKVIKQGKAAACDDRIFQKRPAEQAKADGIAGHVHNKAADARRNFQPVLQKKRHAEHAALRNLALAVHVKEAKGQNARAQQK